MAVLLAAAILFLQMLPASAQDSWQVVWSDEFVGRANSAPDPRKWTYDIGGGGWGNNELETYTNSTGNAFLDGAGNLIIRAVRSPSGEYTSARLKTQDRFTIAYGKIEARIKIPYGQGIWPAFWMMGQDLPIVGWPASGEIDIMENIGREPSTVHGTIHGPNYLNVDGLSAPYTLAGGQKFADDFHTFAIIWKRDSVEFLVDSISYAKVTPASLPAGTQWVFNKPFFIILNLAVGGDWPGNPNASTQFPQDMTVDYVRVYRNAAEPTVNVDGIVNAASYSHTLAPGSLVSVFGTGLAGAVYDQIFDTARREFPRTVAGVSVSVNGKFAPLTYVSPIQINFQNPWDTPVGLPVNVHVTRNGTASNDEPVAFSMTSPSVFQMNGVAVTTCTGGIVRTGAECTLWGNGFGPKTTPQQDGAPASTMPLPRASNACTLSVGGVAAGVTYCGGAPGLIIDQLNFIYPQGVSVLAETVPATLRIGSVTGDFQLPAPK